MEIIQPYLEALQNSELPTALRLSNYAYPLVNALHIVSIGLLFGSIIALDLRLLGFWSPVPVHMLSRVLMPVAMVGLVSALLTGSLLFSVHAVKYAGLSVFQLKIALIAIAIVNALLLTGLADKNHDKLSGYVRISAALSILFWIAIILCGRMIAYFS